VRVDSGIAAGSEVTPHYDSLLAKVIASGSDRDQALERLRHALADLRILGLPTNAGYLGRLLEVDAVRAGALDTGLIERGAADAEPSERESADALVAAAAIETLEQEVAARGDDPWDKLIGFRLSGRAPLAWELERAGGAVVTVRVDGTPDAATVAVLDGDGEIAEQVAVSARALGGDRASVTQGGRARIWDHASAGAGELWLAAGPDAFAFKVVEPIVEGAAGGDQGSLEAPMPGTVLEVRVAAGDAVEEGQVLVVMESMKMELTLTAPVDTTVAEVLVALGDGVKQGQPLVELEPVE
jgi:acetyl-CoA/propionyl-CoA carboxylase biotin carboxyl carrier protein